MDYPKDAPKGDPPQPLPPRFDPPEASKEPVADEVSVFYGTDRRPLGPAAAADAGDSSSLRTAAQAACLALAGIASLVAVVTGRATLRAALLATAVLGVVGCVSARMWLGKRREIPAVADGKPIGYGPDRGEVRYGLCRVTIPRDHRLGVLESPSIFRLEFATDPARHVGLADVAEYPVDKFHARLRASLDEHQKARGKRQLLVFIHGFNNSFEYAARRTAQLAYDLEYEGVAMFWSWPSQGQIASYAHDENNVRWTEPHLERFLREVSARSGAETIHLIAHSMGNRCLTEALRRLSTGAGIPAAVREVVLTAPDIDAETFAEDVAPAIVGPGHRVTLYASSRDRALASSKELHGGPRLGESGNGIVIIPPLETIDVSAVDTSFLGHAYFGDNTSVISDLYYVLRGHPTSKRDGIVPKAHFGKAYWAFQPLVVP
ncbi:alpha/beta hydrolase (plasmid) [Isosphaeraceae bacterium EP7]